MRKIRLRVREIAHKQGLTVEQLAEKANVPVRTIHRLFCNQYASVSLNTLARLSEALHVHTSDLIEDESN